MIKFFKLTERAKAPTKATRFAAGHDLYALEDVCLHPGEHKTINTGIGIQIVDGWYGRIAPRSGLAAKHGIDVLAGNVDCDYRGELKVVLINLGNNPVTIHKDKAIAQIIIEPFWQDSIPIVSESEIDQTDRGDKGFGSSDNVHNYTREDSVGHERKA